MSKPTLTRKDASDITRLLMACYHEGVCDAWLAQDDAFCEQFVEECRRSGSLGFIDVKGVGESDYVYSILMFCRKYRLERLGREVIMRLKDNSPLLMLCMDFYLRGIGDYISDPDYLRMEGFRGEITRLWKEKEKVQDVRSYVVRKVTEYGVSVKGKYNGRGDKIAAFAYQLWLLTRPVGSGI